MKWETKEDFQKGMQRLLQPLKSHYTKECAGITLGVTATSYDEKAILMESFARPLWALVPFYAGGGTEDWFVKTYVQGLARGTNPDSEEYWGNPGEYDQRYVEMAAIGYALLLAREVFWDNLKEEEQNHVAEYLYTINEHTLPVCNWKLFLVLVNAGLRKVGKRYNQEKAEAALKEVESFYLGDGWYRDGDSGQKDYYVSFAIHFYSLVYAATMEKEDPERSRLFKERAMLFAKQFIYWFDEDGEGVPFGRSLTYRFAQVSFFSACLLAGIEPFPITVIKGIIVRHLDYWLKQPIFDEKGVLAIGYAYPNLIMAEHYNGPGSPYWCMKTFAVLILPDDHPFWTAEAATLPDMPDMCAMPRADMLIRRASHHVTAYTPGVYSPYGHGQSAAKYGKFAYDTKFGFSVSKSCYELHENCPDSMLAFVIDGYVYVRRICEASEIREREVWSRWSPYPSIIIETTIVPEAEGHKRTHRITSSVECEAYDCGFSVPFSWLEPYIARQETNWSQVENPTMVCQVAATGRDGKGYIIQADPNTNVLYPKTLIPAVKYKIYHGEQEITTSIIAKIKEISNV